MKSLYIIFCVPELLVEKTLRRTDGGYTMDLAFLVTDESFYITKI